MHRKLYFMRLSDKGRKMARARWDADRKRRDAEEPARLREMLDRIPSGPGDCVGCLQYRDHRSGTVKRWRVIATRDPRRVILQAPDGRQTQAHGWTWHLNHLRPYLAGRKA